MFEGLLGGNKGLHISMKNKSKLLVPYLDRINMREGLDLQYQSDESPVSEHGAM